MEEVARVTGTSWEISRILNSAFFRLINPDSHSPCCDREGTGESLHAREPGGAEGKEAVGMLTVLEQLQRLERPPE